MMARIVLFLAVLASSASLSQAGTLLAFDDLNHLQMIPNGYDDLAWVNFFALDTTVYGPSGYANGVVSLNNVAYNGNAQPALIKSAVPFDLVSGYFTAAWNDGLTVVATGYLLGVQVISKTFQVNTRSPSFQQLNFIGIDSVSFTSTGGVHNPAYASNGMHFAMDNLLINRDALPIPEPSSFVMAGIAIVAGLGAYTRRCKAAWVVR